MEHKPEKLTIVVTTKPSVVVLISKLLLLEIVVVVIYSLVKVPQIVFFTEFGDILQRTNLISLITVLILSLGQMLAVSFAVLAWANEYYHIRNGSIIHRLGIFKVLEEEYSLRNIEALTLEQSFFQRLFNYGTIHFFSPVLKQEYYLTNISRPQEIRDIIDEIVNSSKSGQNEKIIFRR